MATFTETTGNIFDSSALVLVNPVNCVGTMGAGLAKQFKTRYPDMDRQYRADCRQGLFKPGTVRLYRVSPTRMIANFPTKDHWKNPSRIEYIEDGLISLNQLAAERQIGSIAIPAIGTGYGGLDWNQVKPLIRNLLTQADMEVEICLPR